MPSGDATAGSPGMRAGSVRHIRRFILLQGSSDGGEADLQTTGPDGKD
jgi:hypothetical protein